MLDKPIKTMGLDSLLVTCNLLHLTAASLLHQKGLKLPESRVPLLRAEWLPCTPCARRYACHFPLSETI